MKKLISRRHWLKVMSAFSFLPLTASAVNASQWVKTVKAAEGPFYPTASMRTPDIDNDLVKIEQNVKDAGGEIVHLNGKVLDTSGQSLSDLRVEIWQCDVNGRYMHTGDRSKSERDLNFQGFGHTYTDQHGGYEFRTIMPVSYPGRTPHIHVKVFREDTVLTTQFYIKDHPENARDGLYRRMSAEQRAGVEMDFKTDGGRVVASLDVVC